MKNLLKIGCFGIVLFFLGGCYKSNIGVEEKYVPVMPPITTIGANTFGCYVNGKLWVAFTNPQFFDPNAMKPTFADFDDKSGGKNWFYLTGYLKYDNFYQVMNFSIILDNGIGKYLMKKQPVNDERFVDYHIADPNQCAAYQLDETKSNQVEITFLDQQKRIAAGKFEMTVYNECGDTLKITDGRFDVKFY
jgi:hypothetical protein